MSKMDTALVNCTIFQQHRVKRVSPCTSTRWNSVQASLRTRLDKLQADHKRGLVLVGENPLFFERLVPITGIPKLKQQMRAALEALAWFRRHGPAWAQPLPISEIDQVELILAGSLLQQLGVAYIVGAVGL